MVMCCKDLPSYAANYSGPMKYQRLMFIADICPPLRPEALKLAHDYIKTSTLDVDSYNQIFRRLAVIVFNKI